MIKRKLFKARIVVIVSQIKPTHLSLHRRQNIAIAWNLATSDNCWSAFCVFHVYFWEKNAQFQNMCAKKRNDFRQVKTSNFRVEKCKTEENLSKFLNNMAYKTMTSMRDCVMTRKFM